MINAFRMHEEAPAARLSRPRALGSGLKLLPVLFLLCSFAHADTVGLQFKSIKVSDLVESVCKGILHRDYVISPDVAAIGGTLSISVKAIERSDVVGLLNGSLSSVGVGIADRGGVLYVDKFDQKPAALPLVPVPAVATAAPEVKPEPEKDVAAYFPRYRTAEILSMAAKAAGAAVVESKDTVKRDSVIYVGTPATLAKVAKLLVRIDQPLASVEVKAALLEVTDTTESDRSIDGVLNLLRGRLGLALSGGTQQPNAVSVTGSSLSAVLSALDGDTHFKYLSQPSIRVLDGETAKLTVGSDVPVQGDTTMGSNGATVQGVQYRTAGVVLTIEPRILADSILLKINQQVSSFTTTTTSTINSPTMQKREAQTVVDAQDGEVVVIAGMDETKDSRTGSGLSWLPAFLHARTESTGRSQVLLLLEVTRYRRPTMTL